LQDPEDAIENAPVTDSRNAPWLVRQYRLKDRPFRLAEGVSHHKSSFSELESHDHLRAQAERDMSEERAHTDIAAGGANVAV
jgi:hypothetical protein